MVDSRVERAAAEKQLDYHLVIAAHGPAERLRGALRENARISAFFQE